jgi:glycine/D-amino acid oxidase-like deaminating enzyme
MATPRHTVVLGGGVIGISIATHVSRQGIRVTVVTDADLASGASGRSLSWLNSAGARSAEYHALRMAGIDRYRTMFAADPGRDWLRFNGGLRWSKPGAEARERDRHAAEVAHAYDSRLLPAEAVPGAVAGVRDGAVPEVGIHNRGEGSSRTGTPPACRPRTAGALPATPWSWRAARRRLRSSPTWACTSPTPRRGPCSSRPSRRPATCVR